MGEYMGKICIHTREKYIFTHGIALLLKKNTVNK